MFVKSILSIICLFYSFAIYGQTKNNEFLKKYFLSMDSSFYFQESPSNNVDTFFSTANRNDHSLSPSLSYIWIERNKCIGIISNFFSEKREDTVSFDGENNHLVFIDFKKKYICLFLNRFDVKYSKFTSDYRYSLPMSNSTVYFYVFDFKYNFCGEIRVYPETSSLKPYLSIFTKHQKKYYKKNLYAPIPLFFGSFQNIKINTLAENTSLLLIYMNKKKKEKLIESKTPFNNYIIKKWKVQTK